MVHHRTLEVVPAWMHGKKVHQFCLRQSPDNAALKDDVATVCALVAFVAVAVAAIVVAAVCAVVALAAVAAIVVAAAVLLLLF